MSKPHGKEETDARYSYTFQKGVPVAVVPPASSTLNKASLVLDEYKNSQRRRGKCLIINNHHFDMRLTGQRDREGTDVDAQVLQNLFASLGFEVERLDDQRKLDMSVAFRQAAMEDHSDADCFVGIILSHGEEGVVYGTDGTIPIDKLLRSFKGDDCPSLAGKPKLFFIQACRGRAYDYGVEVADSDTTDAGPQDGSTVRKIPIEADFLLAYSVVPGYFSWRNNEDGSWFIQALVRVLREHSQHMELMQMMTLVNKIVAFDFESCTDSAFTDHMKQVPCMVSTLTKQFFFRPKH